MANEIQNRPKKSLLSWVKSTIAAAAGIQTDKNRVNDFTSTSIIPYIVSGIIFTILFVISVTIIALLALKLLTEQ